MATELVRTAGAQLAPGQRVGSKSRQRRRNAPRSASAAAPNEVWLLDYGAGNVRSVRNAVSHLGFTIRDVTTAAELLAAPRLLFPGVGAFGTAMEVLQARGFVEPLKEYIQARPAPCPSDAADPQAARRAAPSSASAWACSCCLRAARRWAG